jgi:hypothetical protein
MIPIGQCFTYEVLTTKNQNLNLDAFMHSVIYLPNKDINKQFDANYFR